MKVTALEFKVGDRVRKKSGTCVWLLAKYKNGDWLVRLDHSRLRDRVSHMDLLEHADDE